MHSPRPAASHTSNPVNGSVLPEGSWVLDDVAVVGAGVELALVAVVVAVGVTLVVVGVDEADVGGVVEELPVPVVL